MPLSRIRKPAFFLTLCIAMLLSASACNETNSGTSDSFDRRTLLKNIAQNVVLPSFNQALTKTTELQTSIEALTANPSQAQLAAARTAWIEAYSTWQSCQVFDFGPAEMQSGSLVENIGTFPINTQKIESYISKADTSFRNFDRDSRGFLCIEYLLFAQEPNVVIETLAANPSRCAYLRSVVRDIQTQIQQVYTAWQSGYADSFASDNSTSAGSSISDLFNGLNKSYENIKNFKVALPLGLRAGQTTSEPTKTEAYYSGESRRFLELHLQAIERLWYGKSFPNDSSNGIGFEEYLNTLSGGTRLVEDTKAQIAALHNALALLPSGQTLAQLAQNNDAKFIALHTEMQKLTRFFKSEMSSLMGIAITYASGDGD